MVINSIARKIEEKPANLAEREPDGKFAKGVSANPNGRPKGSRNKLSEDFLRAVAADFEEHGIEAIQKTRLEKPEAYLKIVASILPKELNVNRDPLEDMTDEQLMARAIQLGKSLGFEMIKKTPLLTG